MIDFVLLIIVSYITGSFPTAILAGKLLTGKDIRTQGSGNAGATNVFRVLGWKPGLAVMLIDISKGFVPVFFLAPMAFVSVELDPVLIRMFAGTAAIAGHVWTCFAGFKGGKGVATGFGMLAGLTPAPALITLLIWVVITAVMRVVSLASMIAAAAYGTILLIMRFVFNIQVHPALHALSLLLAIFIIFMHRKNIRRLIRGEEKRLGKK